MTPNGGTQPNVASNNTIFNNGCGLLLTEEVDSGALTTLDYATITNNIIVNNGTDNPSGGGNGLVFFAVSGTHNLYSNNMIYGNKPSDYRKRL